MRCCYLVVQFIERIPHLVLSGHLLRILSHAVPHVSRTDWCVGVLDGHVDVGTVAVDGLLRVCELAVGVRDSETEVLESLCDLYLLKEPLVLLVPLGGTDDAKFPIGDFRKPRENPIKHIIAIVILIHEITVERGDLLAFIVHPSAGGDIPDEQVGDTDVSAQTVADVVLDLHELRHVLRPQVERLRPELPRSSGLWRETDDGDGQIGFGEDLLDPLGDVPHDLIGEPREHENLPDVSVLVALQIVLLDVVVGEEVVLDGVPLRNPVYEGLLEPMVRVYLVLRVGPQLSRCPRCGTHLPECGIYRLPFGRVGVQCLGVLRERDEHVAVVHRESEEIPRLGGLVVEETDVFGVHGYELQRIGVFEVLRLGIDDIARYHQQVRLVVLILRIGIRTAQVLERLTVLVHLVDEGCAVGTDEVILLRFVGAYQCA